MSCDQLAGQDWRSTGSESVILKWLGQAVATNWQAGMAINWQGGSSGQLTEQESRSTGSAWMAIFIGCESVVVKWLGEDIDHLAGQEWRSMGRLGWRVDWQAGSGDQLIGQESQSIGSARMAIIGRAGVVINGCADMATDWLGKCRDQRAGQNC
jgi:hypothetical protein